MVTKTGLEILGAMLEQDRTALGGTRYGRVEERSAYRAGTVPGELLLGGRKVMVRWPRVLMDRAHRRVQIRGLLEQRDREGLTYRELARQTGESPTTLAWWRNRLRRERRGLMRFVELVPKSSGTTSRGGTFEIVLRSGRRVVASAEFEEGALRRLLGVLE